MTSFFIGRPSPAVGTAVASRKSAVNRRPSLGASCRKPAPAPADHRPSRPSIGNPAPAVIAAVHRGSSPPLSIARRLLVCCRIVSQATCRQSIAGLHCRRTPFTSHPSPAVPFVFEKKRLCRRFSETAKIIFRSFLRKNAFVGGNSME